MAKKTKKKKAVEKPKIIINNEPSFSLPVGNKEKDLNFSIKKEKNTAELKDWEFGERLRIKIDDTPYHREYTFVEKTDKGIWVRPYAPGSPKNLIHVAFADVIL